MLLFGDINRRFLCGSELINNIFMKNVFLLLLIIVASNIVKGQTVNEFIRAMQAYEGKFDVCMYGANPNDSLDDSEGIQAAINAHAAAGYGKVWIPAPKNDFGYHYYLDNAPITSLNFVNPNCQIYIPLQTPNDAFVNGASKYKHIILEGETMPNFFSEGVAVTGRSENGCIIESRYNSGTGNIPAVFGTPWAGTTIGDRNYCKVTFENLIIRTSTKSPSGADVQGTMSAINFARLCCFDIRNIKVDISSVFLNSVEPVDTYGIIFPDVNNKNELQCEGNVHIEGYAVGMVPGEHMNADHVCFHGNVVAILVKNGYYPITFKRLNTEYNRINFKMAGTMNVEIFSFESEHYTLPGKWFTFEKDIEYVSDTGEIRIFSSTLVQSYVGHIPNSFTADPQARYKIFSGHGKN